MEALPNPGKVLLAEFRDGEIGLGPGTHFIKNGDIIVHRAPDGTMRAALNRCQHQGGRFVRRDGCTLTCPLHGWQLDPATMTYTNPTGNQQQPELEVVHGADGQVAIYEQRTPWPWEAEPIAPQERGPGRFTIRFYAHACCEFRFDSCSLFTDPWLTGPAFLRGWWLTQTPPPDWLDRLAGADLIYISHNHSDHLNPRHSNCWRQGTPRSRSSSPPSNRTAAFAI
jgi:CMP-N-acetylneuraminate monooxygenase